MKFTRDQIEAYVYNTEEHRERPDWEEILEGVAPLAAKAYCMIGRWSRGNGGGFWPDAKTIKRVMDSHEVEDTLVQADDDLKAQIFEKILKNEGIF